MADITTISDYTGEVQLQFDNATKGKFNVVRDAWTNRSLNQLLGAQLTTLFLADLDPSGIPQAPRFTDIFDAFAIDENNDVVESKGIKEYIKGIVWFYFARNNTTLIRTGGNTVPEAENSENELDQAFIVRMHNDSIATGEAIQFFIREDITTYPEYNGQELQSIIPNL